MNDSRLQSILSKLMFYGVLLAAAVMLVGGAIFLFSHGGDRPGDHVFKGEPHDLRDPIAVAQSAIRGSNPAWIQLGVLILLANPFVRVAMSAIGFTIGKDPLYAVVSLFVFAVLVYSFFL